MHDALVFGPAWKSGPDGDGAGEVVIVASMFGTLDPPHDNTLIFLHYRVPDEPHVEVPLPSDVFNRVQPHWIWDEFDLIEPNLFAHSILISRRRPSGDDPLPGFRCSVAPLVNPEVFKNRPAKPLARMTA